MDDEGVDDDATATASSTVAQAPAPSPLVVAGGEGGGEHVQQQHVQEQEQQDHQLATQYGHHCYQQQQQEQQVLDVVVQMTTTRTTTAATATASPLPAPLLPPAAAAANGGGGGVDHGTTSNTPAVNMNDGGIISTTADGGIATAMVAGSEAWDPDSVSASVAHDHTNNPDPTAATTTTATGATGGSNSNANTDTNSGGRYSGVLYGEAIYDVQAMDVLNGRGAAINSRPGNKKFRALCFAHKALFDAGNHAAKRRIATEIVSKMIHEHQSRFLRLPKKTTKKNNNTKKSTDRRHGHDEDINTTPYYFAMTFDQAILKAQQIMRDYKRPDRMPVASASASVGPGSNTRPTTVQHRTITQQEEKDEEDGHDNHDKAKDGDEIVPPTTPNGTNTTTAAAAAAVTASVAVKKLPRTRSVESTPMVDVVILDVPSEPLVENPSGVHSHDVLSGRGAFVNGHVGNETLRNLALERKSKFDSGSYMTKRALAKEIFEHIKRLDPPGRFLRKVDPSRRVELEKEGEATTIIGDEWEELLNDKAITKCCQTMRDIARPDRQDRRGKQREEQKRKNDFMTVKTGHDVTANSESNGSRSNILHDGQSTHYQEPLVNMDPSSELAMHHHSITVTNEMLTKLAEKVAVEAVEGVVDEALHGTSTVGI